LRQPTLANDLLLLISAIFDFNTRKTLGIKFHVYGAIEGSK